MLNRMTRSLLAVALGSSLVSVAAAQTPPWNRRPLGVEIRPDAGRGQYVVVAGWTFDLNEGATVPRNLSIEAEVLVNGRPVTPNPIRAEVLVHAGAGFGCNGQQGNCGGNCGNSTYDGLANDLFCRPDAERDCNCGPLWLTAATLHGVELEVGDELSVIISAAPGALPEIDVSDDVFAQVFIPCPGDVNGDGSVGLPDLAELLANFGRGHASFVEGDLNLDGIIDLADLAELLSLFGTHC